MKNLFGSVLGALTIASPALFSSCGDKPRLETVVDAVDDGRGSESEDEAIGVDVPSEAEAEHAAREAIGPDDFEAEIERLKAELKEDR